MVMGAEIDRLDAREPSWLTPEWPAPKSVRAVVITRLDERDSPPYGALNTADHVGDCPERVERNRQRFSRHFRWQNQPFWLNQVHGTKVVDLSQPESTEADASVTRLINSPCVIHTADCLPVFFSNSAGSQVALAHAGWRGLLGGVLENTLSHFSSNDVVYAWLGPAIGPAQFEVGVEVYHQFVQADPCAEEAFVSHGHNRYLCDLYVLARQRLSRNTDCQVFGGDFCTYSDPRFFSYRREPVTGRMLSLIWIDSST